MSEAPSLLSLSEAAQARYPKAPAAMAVLAHTPPGSLADSLEQVAEDDVALGAFESSANELYEIASRRARASHPSLDLPPVAQMALDAENFRAGYQRSVELAGEVGRLQSELAIPMRLTAALLTGLGLVVVGEDAELYAAQHLHTIDTLARQIAQGAMFEAIGAVIGFRASKVLISGTAKRRARKIATRMNTFEELSVYFPPEEETEENKVGTVITSGSETGKVIESTFLGRTYKVTQEVPSGPFLDRRARWAARRIWRSMDYSANAQLRYPTSDEQRDSLLA